MDVIFVVVALALIWRGPELAKLMDAWWSEWTRDHRERREPIEMLRLLDEHWQHGFCTIKHPSSEDALMHVITQNRATGVVFAERRVVRMTRDELDAIVDDSERRARIRAYRAGRGMGPKA